MKLFYMLFCLGFFVSLCSACDGESALDRELKELEDKSAKVKAQTDADWEKYGAQLDEILALKKKIAEEPCDRVKTRELTKLLYKAGVFREVISTAETFWEKCGKFPRIRWTTYEAHKALSEWDEAIEDATVLIDNDPYDKDFWWWRGMAYEKKEDWANAALNYEQAISLVPQLRSIPFNLANMYEKMDQPCDAIWPLEQFMHYHPNVRNADKVWRRIDGLHSKPQCKDLTQKKGNKVTIKVDRASGILTTRVKVNGTMGTFIVDSGASFVALSQEFADKAKISYGKDRPLVIQTANGTAQGNQVTLDEVAVKGLKANRVRGVVLDNLPEIDGLLGLSYLSRYKVTFESDRVTIAP